MMMMKCFGVLSTCLKIRTMYKTLALTCNQQIFYSQVKNQKTEIDKKVYHKEQKNSKFKLLYKVVNLLKYLSPQTVEKCKKKNIIYKQIILSKLLHTVKGIFNGGAMGALAPPIIVRFTLEILKIFKKGNHFFVYITYDSLPPHKLCIQNRV